MATVVGAVAAVACTVTTHTSGSAGFQAGTVSEPPSQPTAATAPAQTEAGPSEAPVQTQTPPGQVRPIGDILSDPEGRARILSGAMAAAPARLGEQSGGDFQTVERGVDVLAREHARGMQPVTELLTAEVREGGHASAALNLEPGHCYVVVGASGAGVEGHQLNLITAPPMPPQVVAQSPAEGKEPVIGAAGACVRAPDPNLPFALKLDMHVTKGNGLVGARVFRKSE